MYLQLVKQIAIPNKYTKWYLNICENAQNRANNRKDAKRILGNTEKHHILPKSFNLGGDKDILNFAYLSIHEHFIVHHLLTKMFSSKEFNTKMMHALTQFSMGNRKNLLSSRQIALAMTAKHSPCSEQRSSNISKSRLQTTKKECNFCLKSVDPGNYKRFHGENCKYGPNKNNVIANRKITAMKSYNTQIDIGVFVDVKTRVEAKGGNIHAHNNIIRICPHCNKKGKGPVMLQKHFNHCPKFSDNLPRS